MFDAKEEAKNIINWIQNYFKENGSNETKTIIGISGGVDSLICTQLCIDALGKDRVIGILIPDSSNSNYQKDYEDGMNICKLLDIEYYSIDINRTKNSLYLQFTNQQKISTPLNSVVKYNTPARLRMTALYMIGAQLGGRVVNTCNLSETYVGYDTKWGDNAGDFAPIASFTKTEIKQIGLALDLPKHLINRTPDDGMCGQSDEDRFGFTYEQLDKYIRNNKDVNVDVFNKIDKMHKAALHKINSIHIPHYTYNP